MAEGWARRKSWEFMIDFGKYTSEFESHKQDMKNIAAQLKTITEETIKTKTQRFGAAGAGAAAGAFLGLLFATVTGGFSSIFTVTTLTVGGAVAGVCLYKIKCDRETVEKVKILIREYKSILKRLKEILVEVRRTREDMWWNTEYLDQIQTEMEEFVTASEAFIREYSVGHLRDLNLKSQETLVKLELLRLEQT